MITFYLDLSWQNDITLLENESINVTFLLSLAMPEVVQVFLNTSHQHSSADQPPVCYPYMVRENSVGY